MKKARPPRWNIFTINHLYGLAPYLKRVPARRNPFDLFNWDINGDSVRITINIRITYRLSHKIFKNIEILANFGGNFIFFFAILVWSFRWFEKCGVLTKTWLFGKFWEFWRKFGFLEKIWIFGENLDFWRKFGFLKKIWIFDPNLDF